MLARCFGYTLVLCVLATTSAFAQTPLRWKFAQGQVFEVERITSQKQTVEIKGKQFKQDRQSTWHVRLEVQETDPENSRLTAVLTRVEHQLAGGAATEMVDPKLAEKMQGCSFTLRVTPHGKLSEFKGHADFLKKLAGDDKGRIKAFSIMFPEESLKEAFADLFGPLPEKRVVAGDAWAHAFVEPIPHFGSLRSTARYVYEGKSDQHDRIAYTIQTLYELPKDELMLLFRIVKGNIRSEQSRGTIQFDGMAGRLALHERSMLLRGTLTIESMDRQQPLDFTSLNEVKVRIKK